MQSDIWQIQINYMYQYLLYGMMSRMYERKVYFSAGP